MEGQSFEEQHETPKPETGPEVDIEVESVLEKREIESVEQLQRYFKISVVKLKDDGQAMFKETSDNFVSHHHLFLRSELELIAARIDKRLGFGLVPPTVTRTIKGCAGVLQERIFAKVASQVINWEYFVDDLWLAKAAVFDYLIDNRDRHDGNFLIDPSTGRMWLIDHDYLSLIIGGSEQKQVLKKARDKNLTKLSEDMKESLILLLADIDSLKQGIDHDEVVEFVEGVKTRAQALLNKGTLA